MGLQPILKKKVGFTVRQCAKCGQSFGPECFAPSKSLFYADGVIPYCNDCIDTYIAANDATWEVVDKLCQYSDIPFIPKEWQNIYDMNPVEAFYRYSKVFSAAAYEDLGWKDYYNAFKQLKEANQIERELPEINEDKRKKLKERWGANYDDEALQYLEGLFNGLIATQNVNGALQIDQALKLCKMSYEIDSRIAAGEDFDKLLGSYDKMVKTAEFTPKNAKNINDFDTFGEAAKWLEKRGWRNKFYDGVTRDIVDESMKNFQNFNQRLYTNESNIAEEISRRLDALKNTAEMENYYGTDKQYDLDNFDQSGYNELFGDDGEEEFQPEEDARE